MPTAACASLSGQTVVAVLGPLAPSSSHGYHQRSCTARLHVQVLGLTEGYHGDTLGAMDAVAPSPFNGRRQTPWYAARGLFLEPPTAGVRAGRWQVALPADVAAAAAANGGPGSLDGELEFQGQEGLFAVDQRMAGPLYRLYRSAIQAQLQKYAQTDGEAAAGPGGSSSSQQPQPEQQEQQGRRLGALILEPVLQGAGGMRLIDPLYQRALVEVCRQACGAACTVQKHWGAASREGQPVLFPGHARPIPASTAAPPGNKPSAIQI